MIDWQPIETAPKDGTRVLLGRFTNDPRADRQGHIEVDRYRNLGDGAGYVGWGRFNMHYWPPTHWARLNPLKGDA